MSIYYCNISRKKKQTKKNTTVLTLLLLNSALKCPKEEEKSCPNITKLNTNYSEKTTMTICSTGKQIPPMKNARTNPSPKQKNDLERKNIN